MLDFLKSLFGVQEEKRSAKVTVVKAARSPIASKTNNSTIKKTDTVKADNVNKPNEKLFVNEIDGKYGFINAKGEQIIECKFDSVGGFSGGLATVKKDGKYGYINTKGEQVVECKFDEASGFSEGLAAVEKDGKYGYINTKGEQVIECKFDNANSFKEGLATVRNNYSGFTINAKGNFVVYDENNNRIEISGKFDEVYRFTEEGLAVVKKDGKYGYINTKGEQVVECKFDDANGFKEGLATVRNNYSGFTINAKGNFVVYDENNNRIEISGKFDEAYSFTEGLAKVKKGSKYGFINTKGEQVIECKFDYADDFREGLARVKKGYDDFTINTKGNFVVFDEDNNQIEVIKEVLDKSGNNFLLSKSDDKFGLLDANYNVLIKNKLYGEFEVVQRMNENTFLIKMAEKEFFIDSNGDFK